MTETKIERGRLVIHRDMTIEGPFGRIVDVAVDSQGRVYVADVLAHQILLYSPSGTPLFPLGREGSGPGEFQAIASIAIHADSLFVLDPRLQRITVFNADDPEGHRLVRTASTATTRGRFAGDRLMILRGGDFLLQFHGVAMSFGQAGDATNLIRRLTPGAEMLRDSVMDLPDREWLISTLPDGHVVEPMPFGSRGIVRLANDTLYHAWSGSPWIAISDANGRLIRRVRLPLRSRPVTESDVTELLHSVESSGEWSRALRASRWQAAWRTGQLPDTFPMIDDFVPDDSGRLWVKRIGEHEQLVYASWGLEYAPGSDSSLILVFDTREQVMHEVALFGGARPAAVRNSKLYVVATDRLGVETVVVYWIQAGGLDS